VGLDSGGGLGGCCFLSFANAQVAEYELEICKGKKGS
jgi:hypothetical protein